MPTQLAIHPGEKKGIERPSFVSNALQCYFGWCAGYPEPAALRQAAGSRP